MHVGSRQNMMDMDNKQATSKYTPTRWSVSFTEFLVRCY